MGYKLESGSAESGTEGTEAIEGTESVGETESIESAELEENAEDFSDCSLEESQYDSGKEIDNDSIDEDTYEDCGIEVEELDGFSIFKQENWEKITEQEKKQALEQLGDYNAEALEIQEKPQISYYNVEDSSDFGGYSAQQNTIYINEYNMNDANETVDTIAHEYRHRYQYERAEKLENEQDLAFKEGFENYIRAEDDYQGYKEQLVEVDARAYAEEVKDKIALSEITPEKLNEDGMEQPAKGSAYKELNPEQGAVFEKVSTEELPEDFTRREVVSNQEGLESKELIEIKKRAKIQY